MSLNEDVLTVVSIRIYLTWEPHFVSSAKIYYKI